MKTVMAWLLAVLLTSCASFSLQKPQIHIADIQPVKTTLLEQSFDLTLRVQNPNNRELTAKGISFDLNVAGEKLATGVSNQAVAIPALGEGKIKLRLYTSLGSWLKQAGKFMEKPDGKLDYEIKGYLDGLNGWGRIPFTSRGSWNNPLRAQ
ncbi:MAG TPA: LEA type 2 family protein [Chromobacteriaceae bacterium]|nr:LEA type 2 family protein [Chromobacteriaceae bacterium]